MQNRAQWLGCVAALGAALGFVQSAQAEAVDPYYVIDRVHVEEIAEIRSEEEQTLIDSLFAGDEYKVKQDQKKSIKAENVDFSTIVQMGAKLWQFVKENKPVLNYQQNYGYGVPKGIEDWRDLSGWKHPETRAFRVSYTNGLGMTVVDLKFRVVYTPGGNLDGKGRYLTHVTIFPIDINVAWAYTLNASVHIPGVVNVGTKEKPVAGMEIHLTWSSETPMSVSQGAWGFFVRGDGGFESLDADVKKP